MIKIIYHLGIMVCLRNSFIFSVDFTITMSTFAINQTTSYEVNPRLRRSENYCSFRYSWSMWKSLLQCFPHLFSRRPTFSILCTNIFTAHVYTPPPQSSQAPPVGRILASFISNDFSFYQLYMRCMKQFVRTM